MGDGGVWGGRGKSIMSSTHPAKPYDQKSFLNGWELGLATWTIGRAYIGAEVGRFGTCRSATPRQLWPAENRVFSLFEDFSANSNPFGSRLSPMIPRGKWQRMAQTDLTTGSPWADHRQSKIDFWPFCGNYPEVTKRTWGFLLGLIDSLGTVLKDGWKKNWKKKKMIFLCIFQVFTHKRA